MASEAATASAAATRTVEKIMSASRDEFARSLAVLLGVAAAPPTPAVVALGRGSVAIAYDPLPAARLGGLLELPRARVTLSFDGVGVAEEDEFLRRFDVAFQRGGG